MNTVCKALIIGATLLSTARATAQQPAGGAELDKLSWLLGIWEQKTAKGSSYEAWVRENDHTFTGKSYSVKGKDTLIFETIRLVQQADGLYYIPTVNNQNDSKPVSFAAREVTSQEMIFTNPEHDFPQQISYKQQGKDSLVAEISGTIGGKSKSVRFPMKRAQ